MKLVQRFILEDSGATAIEYGLIAAIFGAGLIVAFVAFGSSLTGLFTYVDNKAGAALNSSG
jgi:pilus assembly protein Flp/PilA